MLNNFDVVVGQMYRAATHVKRFRRAMRLPMEAQHERLMRIVAGNAGSEYGKKHNFDKIRSVKEFQSLVPPNRYEDLEPYITRVMEGGTGQLTIEEPFMFATTSGTTGKPKYLPITETHLRDYTSAFQVHNYHMIRDYPKAATGRFLVVTSNDEEGRALSGTPFGAVSGVLNRRQPKIIRHHFATPYELCKIKAVQSKYYLMLRLALAQHLTAIICCNPSSLLLMADYMKEHGEQLIADINEGTICDDFAPPPELMRAFAPFLKSDPKRARELQEILDRTGTLKPSDTWPDLAMLCCWKGGPMSFYLDRLPEIYGQTAIRDFGYMASEGRGSIPLTNDGAKGVLAVGSHFFEFVEEGDADSSHPKFLTVGELQVNKRYYIYFTTAAGLYRYNINDLIEVVGFEEKTPLIQFVRKGMGVSSITGEKLTEEQVLLALTKSVQELNLTAITHFTSEVKLGTPPHYVCFAELASDLADGVKSQFIAHFDRWLKSLNIEYAEKRESCRLGMPELRELPRGTYTRLRQLRIQEGAPEAQVKIPLLSPADSFSQRLALL
ncbi:MAG TPA: GH3 auxin-responsive promoter family protein [Chroococcales cyanobacterium]